MGLHLGRGVGVGGGGGGIQCLSDAVDRWMRISVLESHRERNVTPCSHHSSVLKTAVNVENKFVRMIILYLNDCEERIIFSISSFKYCDCKHTMSLSMDMYDPGCFLLLRFVSVRYCMSVGYTCLMNDLETQIKVHDLSRTLIFVILPDQSGNTVST